MYNPIAATICIDPVASPRGGLAFLARMSARSFFRACREGHPPIEGPQINGVFSDKSASASSSVLKGKSLKAYLYTLYIPIQTYDIFLETER